ncbi:MAG: hypothetical protein SAK29_01360 [Scytonema sp. PMC 1069.18]|nr:hypothetical protein [Scytonema sp. PMC 1069.18]MEC4880160.1 hypothetical protein [Scytonema sp. PMC 1070.18]
MSGEKAMIVAPTVIESASLASVLLPNSGIASRIAYNIEFPDYNGEEMHQIFLYMCKKAGRICPPEVSAKMQEILLSEYKFRGKNFGNARDVRNIYEKLVKAQKSRIASTSLAGKEPMSLEEMMTFSLEDTKGIEQKKLEVEVLSR